MKKLVLLLLVVVSLFSCKKGFIIPNDVPSQFNGEVYGISYDTVFQMNRNVAIYSFDIGRYPSDREDGSVYNEPYTKNDGFIWGYDGDYGSGIQFLTQDFGYVNMQIKYGPIYCDLKVKYNDKFYYIRDYELNPIFYNQIVYNWRVGYSRPEYIPVYLTVNRNMIEEYYNSYRPQAGRVLSNTILIRS